MIKIVTVEEMRRIEAATDAAGISYAQMMEYAGTAVAKATIAALPGVKGKSVVVLVGPGNNGGDGLVAGRVLAEAGAQVSFYLSKSRPDDDVNFARVRDAGLPITLAADDKGHRKLREWLRGSDVVIDALLGTGAKPPVRGTIADILLVLGEVVAGRRGMASDVGFVDPARPNPREGGPEPLLVAVDCPSGLDCDTGEVDESTPTVDMTVTFAAIKRGQVTFPGAGRLGKLYVAGIGTPPDLKELAEIRLQMPTGPDIRSMLPPRPRDAHKGTFGKALLVAGSVNYTGAALLAAQSAYRVGAGLVTVAVPRPIHTALASRYAPATWLILPHDMGVIAPGAVEIVRREMAGYSAMLLGPGWGREESTGEFLYELLGHQAHRKGHLGFLREEMEPESEPAPDMPPLVIDADGLNLLSGLDEWWKLLPPGTILTPHPGEMARLTGLERGEVASRRIELAGEKAVEWNAVVVLKGAHTVIAAPDGRIVVEPFATPALATAGTGDVLAGAIVGLLARGLEPFEAAVCGAYIHGLAGELAANSLQCEASVTADDVLAAMPNALATVERAW